MSCRLPGDSTSAEKLWQILRDRKSCLSKIPASRFNVDAFQHPSQRPGTIRPSEAHFMDRNVGEFDAQFFSISPSEASAMDPQQRLLLEVIYEGLENAGLRMEDLAGTNTSCHVGSFSQDYNEILVKDPEVGPKYSATGKGFSMLANRVSWFYDWRGPSFTLDTACSSGLVALHQACEAIRCGDASVAVAAGINIMLGPELFIFMSSMNFLSADGKSKSFDASGDGYGRGEGVVSVILKPLDDAVRDGDCIRAVIRATAINQDGHTSGITLPSAQAQAALITKVYKKAGLDFDSTQFLEAHGTGTVAGDTTESKAVASTLARNRDPSNPLYIGSIKSNIGHTEGAAGLAGLVKAVLMLEKGVIAPQVHLHQLNPKIPFAASNIRVPSELIPWPDNGMGLRRASINSFGYGGTNAHAVVDDAASYLRLRGLRAVHNTASPATSPRTSDSGVGSEESDDGLDSAGPLDQRSRQRLFVLSAHEESVLLAMKRRLVDHLESEKQKELSRWNEQFHLDRLASTLSSRRSRLAWKSVITASDVPSLIDGLSSLLPRAVRSTASTAGPRIGFVFTGQGAQWAGMGRELGEYPVFSRSLALADEHFRSLGCTWSVLEELNRPADTSQLGLAKFSQPLCTALQIALVDLLRSWGIQPAAVVGHSSGEIAAAFCAGALTREAAYTVAYWRGHLCSALATEGTFNGAMLAAGASPETVAPYIAKVTSGTVQVACINSPESVTLSGDDAAVDEVEALLKTAGLFARKLRVENAYHSFHMARIAGDYLASISEAAAGAAPASTAPAKATAAAAMASSVTGEALDLANTRIQPAYWVDNLTSPVQFSKALAVLLSGSAPGLRQQRRAGQAALDILVEVGPHAALQGPIKQILKAGGYKDVMYTSCLARGKPADKTTLDSVGTLVAAGLEGGSGGGSIVDLVNRSPKGAPHGRLGPMPDLPTYPWNHDKAYWAESRQSRALRFRKKNRVDLLGAPVTDAVAGDPAWRQIVRVADMPWVRDHTIQSVILYPVAGMVCMAIEAARQMAGSSEVEAVEVRDVRVERPIIVPDDDGGVETRIQLLTPKTNSLAQDWHEFRISSAPVANGTAVELDTNCFGFVRVTYKTQAPQVVVVGSSGPETETETEFARTLAARRQECTIPAAVDKFYATGRDMGFFYGPSFQCVTEISQGSSDDEEIGSGGHGSRGDQRKSACATIRIGDRSGMMPHGGYEDAHLVHPSTLDCLLQLHYAVDKDWHGNSTGAAVPVFIESVRVAADCPSAAGEELAGYADVGAQSSDMAVGRAGSASPAIQVKGVKCRVIGSELLDEAGASSGSGAAAKERYGSAPLLELSSQQALQRYWQKNGARGQPLALNEILGEDSKDQETALGVSVNVEARLDSKSGSEHDAIILDSSHATAFEAETLAQLLSMLKPTGYLLLLDRSEKQVQARIALEEVLGGNGLEKSFEMSGNAAFGGLGLVQVYAKKQQPIADNNVDAQKPILILLPENWGSGSPDLLKDSLCISLIEADDALALDSSQKQFELLRHTLLHTRRLIWVSRTWSPHFSATKGMMRSVRNENPQLDMKTLEFDASSLKDPATAARIIAMTLTASNVEDRELSVHDSAVFVERYITSPALNRYTATHQDKSARETAVLGQIQAGLQLDIGNTGLLDTLYFRLDKTGQRELAADEIEMESRAFGVNFRDVMTLLGQLADVHLGREASGVVLRVGSGVTRFRPGDAVFQASAGSFKTILRTKEALCQPVPSGMSFAEAASIPIVFTTALGALRDVANIQPGETILINAAAGGVGQAAIQLAQHYGATILASVGSAEKARLLTETYGIPADHIFSSRDGASLVAGVRRVTGGKGVDVVINSLAGELLRQTWHCIAPFGRFVELGIKDINAHAGLDMSPFARSASFAFFNLDLMLTRFHDRFNVLLRDLLEQGVLRPVTTINEYPLTRIEAALRFMQAGKHVGKIVINLDPADTVSVHPTARSVLRLRPDVTYLVVGGLRGLGRSLALHMASCGARHLALVSRSGPSDPNAAALLRRRVYSCDVADAEALRQVLETCRSTQPRIAGAMVLRDGIFETMPFDDVVTSVRPKVQGSWNLHEQLPPNLDFFILLSSISGVSGNPGQANYAAGNTFMDSLASFRRGRGQAGLSLDLGLMLDVGVVAESREGDSNLDKWASSGLREREFLLLMNAAMRGEILDSAAAGTDGVNNNDNNNIAPEHYTLPSQIITGLPTGGAVRAMKNPAEPPAFSDPRFRQLAGAELDLGADGADKASTAGGGPGSGDSLRTALEAAAAGESSLSKAADAVTEAIRNRLARMMDTSAANIEAGKALHAYGVDSLTAVEIRNWLVKEARCDISLFSILGSPSIADLAIKVAESSKWLAGGGGGAPASAK
ncbi:LOW QUALITY PROTEIN: uncharacterized protein B0I36DRAFT_391961 [Microdochium trichocladiopsis]|uniref:Polyketide synthase n=1 Tax=Microdochium trichocladiopsis TaxID=1682393 RepID=A0A9P8YLG1_9PEZI|nr:LOW QUALITY PROTEIN: uncharacterized protein B0I36DRAFT_391961 [Microdochium trichocladiopsis]KAH7041155.1 LOW QUALITY PROTEIN: hypothetical protein B0I36DRAFT_391961 [Microdochium trichocladiopsis]